MKHKTTADLPIRASALLDQQCWCWGQDISFPKGNILTNLGFSRYRSISKNESSLYTAQATAQSSVWLWGYGCAWSMEGQGSIFIKRHGFNPKLSNFESFVGCHNPESIIDARRPSTTTDWKKLRFMLSGLFHWISSYEHWIIEKYGLDYRQSVISRRPKPSITKARDMATQWEHLALSSRQWEGGAHTHIGPWRHVMAKLEFAIATNTPITSKPISTHHTNPLWSRI